MNRHVNVFANYSWQGTPMPKASTSAELNLPAKNRFNVGASFDYGRFLGDLSVTYTDSAFWQDVLDDPYHGTTEAYTLVNGGFGVKWGDRTADDVGQGDRTWPTRTSSSTCSATSLKRQVVGELRVQFRGQQE